jgi:hypothetical protein
MSRQHHDKLRGGFSERCELSDKLVGRSQVTSKATRERHRTESLQYNMQYT